MIDIQVEGLIKSFEIGKNVLDGITFQIDQGERVGLLGRNGAGKSTLFRILTGELEPDEGQAIIASGRRVGLISQIPVYPAGYTVEDVLRSAFARLRKLGEEMESLTERMAAGENDPALLRRYDTLSARFESRGDQIESLPMLWSGLELDRDLFQGSLDTGDYVGLVWYSFLLERLDGGHQELGPYQLTVYQAEEVPSWFG